MLQFNHINPILTSFCYVVMRLKNMSILVTQPSLLNNINHNVHFPKCITKTVVNSDLRKANFIRKIRRYKMRLKP